MHNVLDNTVINARPVLAYGADMKHKSGWRP